jgi:nucleoid-associated protein YgaU
MLYQVQSGDSLWSIAQRVYGDGRMWRSLYFQNSDHIFNPNLIYAGQVIRIGY